MDAWEILAANTTAGDGWTRLNELSAKGAGKQVYQGELIIESSTPEVIATDQVPEAITVTTQPEIITTTPIAEITSTLIPWPISP